MKAKEYFEKYGEAIHEEYEKQNGAKEATELLKDFLKEMDDIKEKRHIKFDRGLVPLIREMNQKWNALANLFKQKYGEETLKRDGFWNYLEGQIPELKRERK